MCSACLLQPEEGSRAMLRPKSAQETLVECTELVKDILRTPAVKEQMKELKVHIGDNGGLPIDVQKDVSGKGYGASLLYVPGNGPSRYLLRTYAGSYCAWLADHEPAEGYGR